jgi:hypothetical protein
LPTTSYSGPHSGGYDILVFLSIPVCVSIVPGDRRNRREMDRTAAHQQQIYGTNRHHVVKTQHNVVDTIQQ